MKLSLNWRVTVIMGALALLSLPTQAQDEAPDEGDNWYRVELIIFANRDPQAATSERWPLLPELAYPGNLQRLESGEPDQAADIDRILLRVEDTVPPPVIDLEWDRTIDSLYAEFAQKLRYKQASIALEPLVDISVPRPRYVLDSQQQDLRSEARRINNRDSLELLFHESWLQPIADRDRAEPLLLDSATRFGDYPELQGSILIYSSRYLHVATKLWLNTAGQYLDNDWRMPRPPLAPPEHSTPTMLPFKVVADSNWLVSGPGPASDDDPALPEPDTFSKPGEDSSATEEPISGQMIEQETELMDAPEPVTPRDGDATRPEPASEPQMAAFMALPVYDYPFRHAVLVEQSRRMRSGELHYIDHPLLGIIIRISRYEFSPFIEASAEANPGLPGSR